MPKLSTSCPVSSPSYARSTNNGKPPAEAPVLPAAGREHRAHGRAIGEGYGRTSIRGDQMNLGAPSAAQLADGLRSVF
jgi:hypothetical protein